MMPLLLAAFVAAAPPNDLSKPVTIIYRVTRTEDGIYRSCEMVTPKSTPDIDAARCRIMLAGLKRRGAVIQLTNQPGKVIEIIKKVALINRN